MFSARDSHYCFLSVGTEPLGSGLPSPCHSCAERTGCLCCLGRQLFLSVSTVSIVHFCFPVWSGGLCLAEAKSHPDPWVLGKAEFIFLASVAQEATRRLQKCCGTQPSFRPWVLKGPVRPLPLFSTRQIAQAGPGGSQEDLIRYGLFLKIEDF